MIINCYWKDEILDSVALRFYVGEMKFLPKSPVGAGIGNPREHVNELASSGSQDLFDVGPKVLASKQLCQIAPNPISILRELKSQPERKLVILDRMANENGVLGDRGARL